jgi:farnesyl-diphosphate farnesyltransferase
MDDPYDSRVSEARLRRLLRDVSRSFYISLRWMPSPVRGPMSLAYLLARTSDTLADVAGWPDERKREALGAFLGALGATARTRPVVEAGLEVVRSAGAGLTRGEAELMKRIDEVIGWFWRLPEPERALMRGVLETIGRGQIADVGRSRMADADALDEYTYQVAGCVGDFWTRLCAMKLAGFARSPLEPLAAQGVRLGQGLQLVNILRDVPRDAAAGRSYLPGVDPGAPAAEKWRAAVAWVVRARAGLAAGRDYVRGIGGFRNRFVVWLPILLGEATLDRLEAAGSGAMETPVKVPRLRLRGLAVAAACQAAFR